MDRKIIDEIIGRAITSPEFRKALIDDPRKALTDAGYPVDDAFLALLDPAHLQELDTMATEYEQRFLGGKTVHDAVSASTTDDGGTGDSSPGTMG
ncbi:Os1348 family NHLP clan protein [Archangium lansingense]|uniref:Os1348 family NHLP clan protein n=1 Tax=Archangium lansingense TaxID=2995310 RepID=A0ABT4ALU8_9BACT|nr:Os1348 family NHLP clan protein [Archangium lansinium]MCY1082662.1 Os1348 family NHLP clan protein [Archangium lansinium]